MFLIDYSWLLKHRVEAHNTHSLITCNSLYHIICMYLYFRIFVLYVNTVYVWVGNCSQLLKYGTFCYLEVIIISEY